MNTTMQQGIILTVVVGTVLLFMTVVGSCTTIEPGHRGVRITLGKTTPEALSEGVAFKWPFGVSRIEQVSIRQETQSGKTSCFSKDQQTIVVDYAVMFRLAPDKVVDLFQNYAGDPFESLIRPRLEEALKQTTAKFAADQLAQSRAEARSETLKKLQDDLAGLIEIVDFSLTNIDLSDEVEKKIEEKMVAEQDAKKAEFEKMRQSIQNQITVERATAEAESAKILGESLVNNPLVLQMEIIKKWNGVSPTVVVLGDTQQGSTPIILPITPSLTPPRPAPRP